MAGDDSDQERTEAATPRRRQETREQGQVALSQELIGALLLLMALGVFVFGGGAVANRLAVAVVRGVELVGAQGVRPLELEDAAKVLASTGGVALELAACLALPLLATVLLVAYGQIGFELTPKALSFDLQRLDPSKGFKRLFGLRSAMRTLLGLAKLLFVATSMGFAAWTQLDDFARLSSLDLWPALAAIGHITLVCVSAGIASLLALALVDLVYQRWQHEKDQRMTKQEVRQELRMSEGDPQLKARIRRVQRELASRRMMQDVPKATVVVTNPTHFAVALRYERETEGKQGRAPRIIAKGVDAVAERIKQVAREAGVLCYEDVALARSLHRTCEIGDEVPVELYQAVAGVLAYVYRIQGKQAFATV